MEIVIIALFGLAVGSFLNVLVFRTHKDIPLTGRSKCLKCEEPIGYYDLIPIVSYFLLRGRCRKCKVVISWQYPLIEAVTAILFVFCYLKLAGQGIFTNIQSLISFLIFTIFLIIIFVYDLRYGYILDQFTLPAMIIVLIINLILGSVSLPSMFFGALAVGGFFAFQYFVSGGKWIGDGDIRMGIVMGLMLGLSGGILALLLSYVIGGFFAVGVLITKKKQLNGHLPLGTFLSIGTFLVLLYGEEIFDFLFLN